jgi:hypothetical protein
MRRGEGGDRAVVVCCRESQAAHNGVFKGGGVRQATGTRASDSTVPVQYLLPSQPIRKCKYKQYKSTTVCTGAPLPLPW